LREELKKVTSKHSISLEHFFIPSRQRIAPASKQERAWDWVSSSRGKGPRYESLSFERLERLKWECETIESVKNKLCRRTIKEMIAVNFGGSRSRFKGENDEIASINPTQDKLRKNRQTCSIGKKRYFCCKMNYNEF